MARITQAAAAAWGEASKLGSALATLDVNLLPQIEEQVVGRLASFGVDTSTWTDDTNTPQLVQTIIAQKYVSWIIDRQYSEDTELNSYAQRLNAQAEMLLAGIQTGDVDIPGAAEPTGQPSFYPNDASSIDDPAQFSMGMTF